MTFSVRKVRWLLNRARYFFAYHTGQTRLSYPPHTISIEATSCCNLRCRMCPHSFNHTWKDGHMDLELYKKIIAEIKEFAFRVILQYRGEALLNKNLIAMIRESKAAGLVTGFNTNATVLTEAISEKLLASGLDSILFSFNGETRAVHDEISQVPVFDAMLANILAFCAMKKRMGRATPAVIVQVLKFRGEPGESGQFDIGPAFKKLFDGLPVDAIISTWACNRSGLSWGKAGVPISSPRFGYMPCRWLYNEMVIAWNGNAVPCCMDFNEEYVLGNVARDTVRSIWNGPRMIALREALLQKKFAEIGLCKSCDALWQVEEENRPYKRFFASLLHAFRK